jgi:glycosyltransferase involved in cell wall biosynthesis
VSANPKATTVGMTTATEGRRQAAPRRFVLVLEQTLGHRVHGTTLVRVAARQPGIDATVVPISQRPRRLPVRWPVVDSWSFQASRATRTALHSRLRQSRPDAVYIHTQIASLFVTDVMRAVPTVVSLDATPVNYDSLGEAYGHRRQADVLERAKFALNRRALRSARAVVAFSSWAAGSVIDDYGVPEGRVEVIPSGVDLDVFGPRRGPRMPGPMRVLFVGGDFVRKGGVDLLEAVARVGPVAEIDVVTPEAPLRLPPGIKVRVHTGLRPESPELSALYRDSDVFCFPSYGDCSPRVIAEAMASGLPVVATDVGGVREMVVDGHSGLLVPVRSPQRLADAIGHLSARPEARRAMGDAGLRLARTHHDGARNAELLFDLLRRCSSGTDREQHREPRRASELVP